MWKTNPLEKTLNLAKIEGRRRSGWQDEMFRWQPWLSGHEFEQTLEIGKDREAWCAASIGSQRFRLDLETAAAPAKSLRSYPTLCNPETAAHQAPPSLGFSRQEHWSGLPLPSPMCESEKWKWSRSVVFDSSRPHGLQPTRLLHPWDFPGKSTGVGCHCLLRT